MKRSRYLYALAAMLTASPSIAQYTARMPSTCTPDGTSCIAATPVVNPDGSVIGAGGASGGATAANQTAAGTAAQTVQGADAINTAAVSKPVGIGGRFGNAATAYTNGQRGDVQIDSMGRLFVVAGSAGTDTDAASNSSIYSFVSQNFGGVTASLVGAASSVFNGTTWDRQRGTTDGAAVFMASTASAFGGTPGVTVQGATVNVLKASAGNLHSINVVNSTAAGYIVVYNAVAAPASGTALTAALTPYCMPIAASVGFDKAFAMPLYLSTGATLLMSTSCTTYTPVTTAPVTLSGQVK